MPFYVILSANNDSDTFLSLNSKLLGNAQTLSKSPFLQFSKFRPVIGFSALKSTTQCKIDRPLRSSGQYGLIMGQNKNFEKNRFSSLTRFLEFRVFGAGEVSYGRRGSASVVHLTRCLRAWEYNDQARARRKGLWLEQPVRHTGHFACIKDCLSRT